jgi:tRNA U34 5-carboxymethylaminomethyl modifying enzyme MnmG/GidA
VKKLLKNGALIPIFTKIILAMAVCLVIVIVGTAMLEFFGIRVIPIEIKYKREITNGNKIINDIEKYYEENKKLPDDRDWRAIEAIFRKAFLNLNSAVAVIQPKIRS